MIALATAMLASAAPAGEAPPQKTRLTHVRRLALDPGHGGDNLGALGKLGVREKVLCLEASRNIAAWLKKHSDLEIMLTRDKDLAIDLRQRPRLANEWQADALVSIHFNAHEKEEAQGMEVFFLAADASVEAVRQLVEREEGLANGPASERPWSLGSILVDMDIAAAHRRAEVFAHALGDTLRKERPGARFRGVRQAPFGVLKEARMPAVVLELGFITHAREVTAMGLPKEHERFAKAILRALERLDAHLSKEAKAGANK